MIELIYILVLGIGATVVMDVWGITRKLMFGTAPPNYGLVGRWIGHMTNGQFRHESIAGAAPIRGEQAIGWTAHYAIGIAFAGLLIGICGVEWIQNPTIGPAIAVGICTDAAPFLIMQPAMGAGIAASRTPRPAAARTQSVITHVVFGVGLYATALATHCCYPFSG